MPDPTLRSARLADLPLCFPGRTCVDVPPGGAQAMHLVRDLTPWSPGVAAVLWAALGGSLVLIGIGVRRRRLGSDLRPSLLLAIALLVGGAALAWLMHGWLGEARIVYGGLDGRPAAPVPASVIGSWPLVQAGARTAMALGTVALLVALDTAAVRRRRAGGAHRVDVG